MNLSSGLSEEVKEKATKKGIKVNFMMLVFSDPKDIKSIASLLEQGILKPHVSKVFDFEDIQSAHNQVESVSTVGKIVVRV